jgi:sugar phosphate isomerase/epimerase
MNSSRRDFVKTALVGLPISAALANAQVINGVQLGVQTYSFHDVLNDGQNHADEIIKKMLACGVNSCELFSPQIEPGTFVGKVPNPADCPKPFQGCGAAKGGTLRNPWSWEFQQLTGKEFEAARAKQIQWRETVSLDYFTAIRNKFKAAGMEIFSYNPVSLNMDWNASDLEIERIVQAAKTLGCKAINVSCTFKGLQRFLPFAEKHQIVIAPHGHSQTWDPEHFSTRATFERAFALSKWVGANLDIGHYTAANEDALAFIQKHHARITNLHVKDRQKNKTKDKEDGANTPFGKGETPIAAVLKLLQKEKYAIPAFIEYEYAGTSDPVDEVKKCLAFCKEALA